LKAIAGGKDKHPKPKASQKINPVPKEPGTDTGSKDSKTTNRQSDTLLELVEATDWSFFYTELRDYYVAIPVRGHTETYLLDGEDFSIRLADLFYTETGRVVNKDTMKQIILILKAKALKECENPVKLHTRIAKYEDNFYYDMTNSEWQVIKISPEGWNINKSPLLFTRYRHQLPQVEPLPGGDVERLLKYIPLKGGRVLFLCWLISCFVPDIPHPVLVLYGEKGASKSTVSMFLKKIIDPSNLETLGPPRNERDLIISLQQHVFLPFDNISRIKDNLSDMFCRAVTGAGVQQRKLHTNADDTIFSFKRILSINGVNNAVTRSDLLDRSILIELERIPEENRREIVKLRAAFEEDRPSVMGGTFDALSKAMKIYPSVKLDNPPRMADFTCWGYAIAEALGLSGEDFLKEYEYNRGMQNIEAVNADPVATLVVAFLRDRKEWSGAATVLLNVLKSIAGENGIDTSRGAFPVHAHVLSRRLREVKSNLEAVGVVVDLGKRTSTAAIITLMKNDLFDSSVGIV